MTLSSWLHRVYSFLRAGYPEGVPDRDYMPLFALLRRRLSEEEVEQIAEELISASPNKDVEGPVIHAAIQDYLHEPPHDSDVERIRQHLAEVGFDVEQLERR